jgi:hypothetical protein
MINKPAPLFSKSDLEDARDIICVVLLWTGVGIVLYFIFQVIKYFTQMMIFAIFYVVKHIIIIARDVTHRLAF